MDLFTKRLQARVDLDRLLSPLCFGERAHFTFIGYRSLASWRDWECAQPSARTLWPGRLGEWWYASRTATVRT